MRTSGDHCLTGNRKFRKISTRHRRGTSVEIFFGAYFESSSKPKREKRIAKFFQQSSEICAVEKL
jgi:hypothetical protein